MPRPNICPHCQAEEMLVAVGPGVERLQEEAAALFPNARTMVLSSDLITSIETMRSELNEIAGRLRADIIVGTQTGGDFVQFLSHVVSMSVMRSLDSTMVRALGNSFAASSCRRSTLGPMAASVSSASQWGQLFGRGIAKPQ